MSAFQPKQHLHTALQRVHRLLVNDLNAIETDKLNAELGGVARSPLHIVAECAAVNGYIATYLQTGQFNRPSKEERVAHLASFTTRESVLAYLEQETKRLIEAIEGLEESTLGDVSDQPFGFPMSRFMVADMPAMHMMYHDGQLNYIQTLHGDDQMHWF